MHYLANEVLLKFYMLSKCMVSFHFALIIVYILTETGIILNLLVSFSIKCFWILMNWYHICVSLSRTRSGTVHLNEYITSFSSYVFHMKPSLNLFLDLHISVAKKCCLWWIFNLFKAKRSSYIAMQLFYTTWEVIYCTFSTLCIYAFEQKI